MAKPLTNDFTTPWHDVPIHPTSPISQRMTKPWRYGVPPQAFTNSPRLFPVGCKGAHNLEVFCAIKIIKSTVSPYKWCIYQVGQKGDRNTYSYSLLLPNTNCLAPKSIHQSAILSYLLAPSFAHQHLLWWHPWVHTGMLSLEEEHRTFDMKAYSTQLEAILQIFWVKILCLTMAKISRTKTDAFLWLETTKICGYLHKSSDIVPYMVLSQNKAS